MIYRVVKIITLEVDERMQTQSFVELDNN